MVVPGLIQQVPALVTGPDHLLWGHSVSQELRGQERQPDLVERIGLFSLNLGFWLMLKFLTNFISSHYTDVESILYMFLQFLVLFNMCTLFELS